MLHRYAEAVDTIGSAPSEPQANDPAVQRATELFNECMTPTAQVTLYFDGPDSEATHAPSEGPLAFARWVRAYFHQYGYVGTYHLVGNIRPRFVDRDAAIVTSYINSTHWLADGRMLLAPIEYTDSAQRSRDGNWRITTRKLIVLRWWVTDGYFAAPGDPTLSRPAG